MLHTFFSDFHIHITWSLHKLDRYYTHLADEKTETWCCTLNLLISDLVLTPLLWATTSGLLFLLFLHRDNFLQDLNAFVILTWLRSWAASRPSRICSALERTTLLYLPVKNSPPQPLLLVNACRYSTPGTSFPCIFPIAYLSLLDWRYWWGNQQPLVGIYYALYTARQWRHHKEFREVSLATRESPKIVPSLWFVCLLSFLSDSGLRLQRSWLWAKRKPRVPGSWPSLWHLLGASSEQWLWCWQAVGHLESWRLVISALPLGLPWQPSLQAKVLLVLSIQGCFRGITFPFWALNIEISLRDPKWPSHPWTEIFLWEIGFHFQPPHLTA